MFRSHTQTIDNLIHFFFTYERQYSQISDYGGPNLSILLWTGGGRGQNTWMHYGRSKQHDASMAVNTEFILAWLQFGHVKLRVAKTFLSK